MNTGRTLRTQRERGLRLRDCIRYGCHGSYDVAKGLIYSFPVVCKGGDWQIVQGLKVNDFSRAKMKATEAELIEERDAVAHLLPK